MRRWLGGAALSLMAAGGTLWGGAACSKDYHASAEDAGDVVVTTDGDNGDAAPPGDAGDGGAACPERFMPQVGLYTYSQGFAGDLLKLNDAALDTQPFEQPFSGRVSVEGAGCFRFTAFLAKGAKGRHEHSWLFCNACDRKEGSLDLVEETDLFEIAQLDASQHTTYTCARPNPYLVTDVAPDANITQASCTGTSDGTEPHTIQTVPVAYVFEGVESIPYAEQDASVDTYAFRRDTKTLVSGDKGDTDQSTFRFDVDSGALMNFSIVANTHTSLGGSSSVDYRLTLVATRTIAQVSP